MVTINNKTYKGDSLRIDNNKIYIDGKLINDSVEDTKVEKRTWMSTFISVFGVSKQILTTIVISGDVKINATSSNIRVIGNITVDSENALTNSNVTCDNIKAIGDINCGDINTKYFSANNVHCLDLNTDEFNAESIECGDLNCDELKTQHLEVKGDLSCDDINAASITIGGDVNCDDITGDVKASEINAGSIYMGNE